MLKSCERLCNIEWRVLLTRKEEEPIVKKEGRNHEVVITPYQRVYSYQMRKVCEVRPFKKICFLSNAGDTGSDMKRVLDSYREHYSNLGFDIIDKGDSTIGILDKYDSDMPRSYIMSYLLMKYDSVYVLSFFKKYAQRDKIAAELYQICGSRVIYGAYKCTYCPFGITQDGSTKCKLFELKKQYLFNLKRIESNVNI